MKLKMESVKNRVKSMWLDVNRNLEIMHLLDFPDSPLYLCDNVRISSCAKEPDTVQWIRSFEKTDTAFDIGANVGPYALIMSVFAKEVFAFEPAITNYILLCKNIMANYRKGTIQSNITPLNLALAQEAKLDSLNYVNLNPGKSGHQIEGRTLDGHNHPFKPVFNHKMPCISMDAFIEVFKIPAPNHIKIDVDGIEWQILQGAEKTLASPNVKSLLVEVDNLSENASTIVNYLKQSKFELANKFLVTRPEDHIYNYLFKRA